MAGALDQSHKAFVKIDGTKFPLPLSDDGSTEEELWPGGEVITNALEGFSPSTVAGDASVVDERRISTLAWSDWTSGLGHKFTNERENIGGYAYGTLDTRYANMAVLPPRWVDLGALGATIARAQFLNVPQHSQIVVWDGASGTAPPFVVRSSAGVWVAGSLPAPHTFVRGMMFFGTAILVATNRGICQLNGNPFTSPAAVAVWTMASGGAYGPVLHDGKAYILNAADRKMYWATDATAYAGAWTNSSTVAHDIRDGNESPIELFEYMNRAGARQVVFTTAGRIVAYDDDDFFTDLYIGEISYLGQVRAVVWEQDRQIYRTEVTRGGDAIKAITHDTVSNVTPNKAGGLPNSERRQVRQLASALTHLWGYAEGGAVPAYLGGTAPPAAGNFGYIMAFNGQGWHTVVAGAAGVSVINAMGYLPQQVLFVTGQPGSYRLQTIFTPEYLGLPYNVDNRTYAEGTFTLRSAIFNAGWENTDKTMRKVTINLEQQDGSNGCPAGHNVTFWLAFDGGALTQYGGTLDENSTWPAVIDLPSSAARTGIVWQEGQWEIRITKEAGADASVTPILRGVLLGYTLSPDIYDGFQFIIDLTKRRFAATNRGRFAGRSRRYLLRKLREIAASKTHYSVEWGGADGGVARSIAAAQIRISARENAGAGFGIYTVTGQDVS